MAPRKQVKEPETPKKLNDATPAVTEEDTAKLHAAGNERAKQILKDLGFEAKMEAVERKVKSSLEKAKADTSESKVPTFARVNRMKRGLYRDSEHLHIELERRVYEYVRLHPDQGLTHHHILSSEAYKNADKRFDAISKPLIQEPAPFNTSNPLELLMVTIRGLTFIFWFATGLFTCCLAAPLRILHRPLVAMGLPTNYQPMDWIQCTISLVGNLICGTEATVRGRELLQYPNFKDAAIGAYNHLSNLDPILIIGYSPLTFKLIGKKVAFFVPILGWAGILAFGNIPINRSNRNSAIKSMNALKNAVTSWNRSIAMAPEGTRSRTGLMLPFKKGPFHLQGDLNIPIAPIVFVGGYEVYPPTRLFCTPGKTFMKFLPLFTPDAKLSRDENRLALRKIMIDSWSDASVPHEIGTATSLSFRLMSYVTIVLVWTVLPWIISVLYQTILGLGYTTQQMWGFIGVIVVVVNSIIVFLFP